MPDQSRLTPEMLVPRMGEYLVQKGLITNEDIQKALAHQQEETAHGNSVLLGQALIDLNLISRADLDQAVTEQILQLRSALQASNRSLERRVEERTAELQKALERVSELSQLKANFIANISHELRTPLTHIKGYIELLVTESLGPLSEEQRHALTISQQSTNRLEKLIDDLIMVSLASRGEMSLKQDSADVCRLAHLAVKSYAESASDRGVHLQANVDGNVPMVHADSQKIAWVIGQLIDNAPNRIRDIFEPFYQLDGSNTRQYSGTGLGLSLVRQIVEAHGSMLEVQSTEGRGSTFKFPMLAVMESK